MSFARRSTDRTGIISWLLKPVSRVYVAVLFVALCFVAAGGWAKVSSDEETVARHQRVTTGALCTLRDDLQARVTASNEFLKTHPRGFAGISAATIRQSNNNEQRTISALAPISCSRPDNAKPPA